MRAETLVLAEARAIRDRAAPAEDRIVGVNRGDAVLDHNCVGLRGGLGEWAKAMLSLAGGSMALSHAPGC